jgi:WD40 repeat protein
VRFFDAATLQRRGQPLDVGDVWVDATILSPDGRTLVVGTDPSKQTGAEPKGDILFVDVATRRVRQTAGTGAPVAAIAFDPSGRRVVASQLDNTARVWDVETGRPVGKPMRNADANILGVSISGDLVATGAWSGRIELWDWKTARHTVSPMETTTGPTPAVALSPDATRVASTTFFGPSRLWDVATGLPIGEELVPPGEPPDPTQTWQHLIAAGLSFNADGTMFASGSAKGVATVWIVDPVQWRTIACDVAGRNLTRAEWRQFLPADAGYRATCPASGTGGSA